MVKAIIDPNEKEQIARVILSQLPDWFGIPESTNDYIQGVRNKPMWADVAEETPIGFISLHETAPTTAEIYVMGVLPWNHRKGSGKALYETLEAYAAENSYHFIQVKTVRKGAWESYDKTNEFYIAMGFEEFECFPELWDKQNPCQIYVKAI